LSEHGTRHGHGRQAALLVLLACGMFGFAFALVPLYDVFCELTGINGKTAGVVAVPDQPGPVIDRDVTIQFLAQVGKGMPWEFRPTQGRLSVRPGEMVTTTFYARNRAATSVTGQAVPSVAPGVAASHLHKIECFCFEQQVLAAGEAVEMPVTFYIDADLPEEISTLSLSYSLFRVPDVEPAQVASN
jgi:cytochrome c oxidase assembly protein subunit 11